MLLLHQESIEDALAGIEICAGNCQVCGLGIKQGKIQGTKLKNFYTGAGLNSRVVCMSCQTRLEMEEVWYLWILLHSKPLCFGCCFQDSFRKPHAKFVVMITIIEICPCRSRIPSPH